MPCARGAVSGLRSLIVPRVAGVVAVALLVVLLAGAGSGQPAYAASITVDTTDDELNSDGDCSLREAIQAANADAAVDGCAAGSGADTVTVPAGTYTLSIAGVNEDANATGDLDITDDLTITGAGVGSSIIDGGGIDRVLHIWSSVTAEMAGMTVQNGNTDNDGGGIYNSNGTLTLTDVTVSGNTANGFGGGIFNDESLTLTKSTVSGNTANFAGGILNGPADTLTLTDVTVSGNTANYSGGGIYNGGTATLTNSTVNGNTAGDGGGILNNSGTATLTNVTVSGNTADSLGGGIFSLSTPMLTNSVVADSISGGDCFGAITSGGHNLDSDDSCGLTGTGDLPNTDPQLGPLADNGGPTQTHALLAGSPAIDAGSADCPPPATDQRGVTRPLNGDSLGVAVCDIGAYEAAQGTSPPPPPGPPLAVGGLAGLLDADAGDATVFDSGGGADLGYVVALAGVVSGALIAGGWYARRRWLG